MTRLRSFALSAGSSVIVGSGLVCASALLVACGASEDTAGVGMGNTGSGGTSGVDVPLGGTGGYANGSGGNTASGGSDGSGGVPEIPSGPSHVTIVAHQDDDLLFINPDLYRTITAGTALATVYITSGNAGMGMDYVSERELGIRSAYAFMANATNSWTCAPELHASKSITACKLDDTKNVKLYFMRLVDGWGDGSADGSIKKLWSGAVGSSAAVDGSGTSYTRDEVLASLSSILTARSATTVYTTDFTFLNRNNDHSDHEIASLFALVAAAARPEVTALASYVTYSTTNWTMNLSADDTSLVADTFSHYAACDKELAGCNGGVGCDATVCSTSSALYQSWTSRHYFTSRRATGTSGQLGSQLFSGYCASSTGTLLSCGSGGETFSYGSDGTLRTTSGSCLTAPGLVSTKTVSVSSCDGSARQRWAYMGNGQIIMAAAPVASESGYALGQCLSAVAGPSASLQLADCTGGDAVIWSH